MATRKRSTTNNKITLTKKKFERLVADEWYVGRLVKIVEDKGQFGEYFRLEFKILNGETEKGKPAKGQRQSLFINKPVEDGKIAITRKSKICKIAKAFGVNIDKIFESDEDLDLDLSKFIKEKLRLYIEDSEKIGDDGYAQQRITSFMHYKKKRK